MHRTTWEVQNLFNVIFSKLRQADSCLLHKQLGICTAQSAVQLYKHNSAVMAEGGMHCTH